MEFFIEKLSISGDSKFVEIDTSVLKGDDFKCHPTLDNMHRRYCNFIINYIDYIDMNLRVGDSIRIKVEKIGEDVKREEQ